MADILPFKPRAKAAKPKQTLCKNGHHKWKVVSSQQFDVKQGRLVTTSECTRCGKRKVQAL
ncbi:hypothetical protein [Oceanicoccus sp. KOV_DT_Chl]|uniref:hypothetical protein n=1 Tax=Oceanicoccus sp. KOV_DT_Chl TaxID=1904639 RepID=UPI000C7B0930|nr:hypothetical protein [Oceanicoccus sp. KOV_DT_Chl]